MLQDIIDFARRRAESCYMPTFRTKWDRALTQLENGDPTEMLDILQLELEATTSTLLDAGINPDQESEVDQLQIMIEHLRTL